MKIKGTVMQTNNNQITTQKLLFIQDVEQIIGRNRLTLSFL